MSEPLQIQAMRRGMYRSWLVQGELGGGRFEVPDDNTSVSFARARMLDVDLSGIPFSSFLAYDSVFERCDFSNASFENVSFGATGYGAQVWDRKTWPTTLYRECTFSRVRMPPHAHFGNARFEQCVFDGARLRGLTSTFEAQFVECTFRGKIQDVNFWGVPLAQDAASVGREHNDFSGNDFTGAELIGVAFKRIDLRAQKFPGLPDYALLDRFADRVAGVIAAIAEWPDGDIKARVQRSLTFRAEEANEYNEGFALVARKWFDRRLPPDVRDRIFQMLVA